MSVAELERLTRRYTAGIIETLGPDSDVPAPDVNTNERVMAWIMDTYSMHMRHTVTAVVTGKPVEMGGSLGRREATGRGCMLVTQEALEHLGMRVAGATVAVQGFGNVGSVAAQLLADARAARSIAIGDRSGGIVQHERHRRRRRDRLHARSTSRSRGTPRAIAITNDDLLTLDVDVLVPAALENVITQQERVEDQGARSSARARTVRPRPPPMRFSMRRACS